jgi:hypothetical protein
MFIGAPAFGCGVFPGKSYSTGKAYSHRRMSLKTDLILMQDEPGRQASFLLV